MSTYSDASLILPVAPEKKAGKIYSLKPTDGTGDFDFTRSGSATRINKDGLIELVSSNVPRLNYPLIDGVVSGCPSLLLEPARTNLLTYSEDFSNAYWTKSNVSLTSGFISPDGTANAFKLVENNSTGAHWIVVTSFVETSSLLNKTFSFYVKKGERKFIGYVDTRFSNGCETVFNLENETIVRTSGVLFVDAKIENFGNGYFKCSITYGGGSDTRTNPAIALLDNNYNGTSVLSYTYTGDGLSGNFIFGVQLEAGSYPTSYIQTNGSSATRSAETCNNAGDVNTFNDSEGVLFAEISVSESEGNYRSINLGNGVNPENGLSLRFDFPLSSNSMAALFYNGSGFSAVLIHTLLDITNINKIAFRYANNNFGLFVNGVKVSQSLTGATGGVNLSNLAFNNGVTGANFYGRAKDLRVYNTALTDQELINLTKI